MSSLNLWGNVNDGWTIRNKIRHEFEEEKEKKNANKMLKCTLKMAGLLEMECFI